MPNDDGDWKQDRQRALHEATAAAARGGRVSRKYAFLYRYDHGKIERFRSDAGAELAKTQTEADWDSFLARVRHAQPIVLADKPRAPRTARGVLPSSVREADRDGWQHRLLGLVSPLANLPRRRRRR